MPESNPPRLLSRILGTVERVGNALPEPATLFAILALGTLVASAIAQGMGLAVAHPATLRSPAGLRPPSGSL